MFPQINDVQIRRAMLGDASRISEIQIFAKRTAYRQIFQDDKTSFITMQVYPLIRSYLEKPSLLENVFVLSEGGIVKAFMRIEEDINDLELAELYVDPFFQKQGIGSHMMQFFLNRVALKRKSLAILWVLEENHQAISFYKGFGFLPTGDKKCEPGTTVVNLKFARKVLLSDLQNFTFII